jgi:hypothetical protein
MQITPQIDFQGLDPSDRLRDRVEQWIARIEDRFGAVWS